MIVLKNEKEKENKVEKIKITNQNFIISSRRGKSAQVQKIDKYIRAQLDVVLLQSTETKIRISHPADEYLAKCSIIEIDHLADKVQAMDSTL